MACETSGSSLPQPFYFNATGLFNLNEMSTARPIVMENLCGPNTHNLHVFRTSQTFRSSSSTHVHYLGPDKSHHEDPQPSVIHNPSHRFNVRRLIEKAPNTDKPGRPEVSTHFYKSTQCNAPKMSNYKTFTSSGIHTPSHSCNTGHVTRGTTSSTNFEFSGTSNLMQRFAPQLSESKVFKSPDRPPLSHTEDNFVRDTLNPSGRGPANISNRYDFDMHLKNSFSIFGDNILDAPVLQPAEQNPEQPVRYTGSMQVSGRRKRGRPRKGSNVLRPAEEPSQKKRRIEATNRNGHSRYPQRINAKDEQHIDPSCRASEDNDAEVQDLMNMFTTINDKYGPYADENSHVPDALELHTKHCTTCPSTRDADSEEIPQRRKKSRAASPNGARKPRSTSARRANPKFWYHCIYPDCGASREKRSRGMPLFADIYRHMPVHLAKRFCCTLPHTNGDQKFRRLDNLQEHLRTQHRDIKHDDPKIKALLSRTPAALPEFREGVHYTKFEIRLWMEVVSEIESLPLVDG